MADDMEGGVLEAKARRPQARPQAPAPAQRRDPQTPAEMEEWIRQHYRNDPMLYNWKRPGIRNAKSGGLIKADGAAIRGRTRGKVT